MSVARIVLVSGTSRGIGRGLAEHFLATGAVVHGCSRAGDVVLGDNYVHHVLDVCDEDAVRRMFADIMQRHGRLDVLVNNAGIGLAALALMTSLASAETVLRTNLLGTILLCREASKLMIKKKAGRIVNMSSIAVPLAMEGASIYSASKAAVVQYTRVLAKELSDFGVTCNIVAPSLVETDMLSSLSGPTREKYLSGMTIKKVATQADVVNAVEFFARAESGALTGQTLTLSALG